MNIAAKDFSKKTIKNLSLKGIAIVGAQMLPDMGSSMPWANAARGYVLDDNGCGKVRSFLEVQELGK